MTNPATMHLETIIAPAIMKEYNKLYNCTVEELETIALERKNNKYSNKAIAVQMLLKELRF